MAPLAEGTSPLPPARRESIFKSGIEQNTYSEFGHRPLVLPVPPQKSAPSRPLSPRQYPRFDVSHLLKRRQNEDVIYDEVATDLITRQSLSLSLSERSIRAFGGSPSIFKNKMLKRPSVLSLETRRCSSATSRVRLESTTKLRTSSSLSVKEKRQQKTMIRILTPPELLLNDENQSPIAPVKSYSIRNRNPIPSVSVRELTNLQATFRPVTPSSSNP